MTKECSEFWRTASQTRFLVSTHIASQYEFRPAQARRFLFVAHKKELARRGETRPPPVKRACRQLGPISQNKHKNSLNPLPNKRLQLSKIISTNKKKQPLKVAFLLQAATASVQRTYLRAGGISVQDPCATSAAMPMLSPSVGCG